MGELGASYLGLNASSFSSYGSEKRGSPVKAFIRWCEPDREIRISSPVEKPHILGLFHEALAGKLPVTAGVWEETKIVINSPDSPNDLREAEALWGKYQCSGRPEDRHGEQKPCEYGHAGGGCKSCGVHTS
ncbi:MAG: 2-oxoacid:acceptor oxidoreductase family protein [Blautia marasmi]